MITLPNPAVLDLACPVTEEVTGITEMEHIKKFVTNTDLAMNADGGWRASWAENPDTHGVTFTTLEDLGDSVVGTSPGGFVFTFRDLDPYDAVSTSGAGVPQPINVVRAQILVGGMMAQELNAVVAPDNTVVTLMLDTGMGTFVRYNGAWQLLKADAQDVDDASVVDVAPGALAVWDAADAAQQTISVFDLPTANDDGTTNDPEEPDLDTLAAISAAGTSIPMIASAADVSMAVRYGKNHPNARWYITKRARALGAIDQIPSDWNVVVASAVMPPFGTSTWETE